MAMGLIPQPLPSEPAERARAWATLANGGLAFIDVADQALHGSRPLEQLVNAIPHAGARARVMLSRAAAGHVSPQDRDWVQRLGFADLVSDWQGGHDRRVLRRVLAWAAALVGLDEPAPQERVGCARAMAGDADPATPRDLVWGLTGESPEAFCDRLGAMLDIQDRRWHLADYRRCFVGSEAVEQWMAALRHSRPEAVALGQALGKLGLLTHVVQEHPFLDQHLFYRLAWSSTLDRVDADALWGSLESALPSLTASRTYHGRSYSACFVGEDAVTCLAQQHGLDRLDAWLALHRIAQWGFIEHVTQSRPIIDGHFFYRWTGARVGGT